MRCAASQVGVLASPSAYLETLRSLVAGARGRVFLSALYLGNDALSRSLVQSCETAAGRGASVRLLFDHGRATRPDSSSVPPLLPLLRRGARLHLWQSPALRRSPLQAVPRLSELLGVFHGKIQVMDDVVVVSGANLSESYFSNRKDRYVVIRDAAVADWYHRLLSTVAEFSFACKSDGTVVKTGQRSHKEMKAAVEQLLAGEQGVAEAAEEDEETVVVTPTVQCGVAGIRADEEAVSRLLASLPSGGELWLTSGYFNLTPHYARLLFRASQRMAVNVVVSSPRANAWHNSKGASRHVPNGYSEIEAQFLRQCPANVRVFEWDNAAGWSYHCKGLWHFGPDGSAVTVVGSGNFGARSQRRDLEMQAVLSSRNAAFVAALRRELDELRRDCRQVSLAEVEAPERKLPPAWKAILPMMKRLM